MIKEYNYDFDIVAAVNFSNFINYLDNVLFFMETIYSSTNKKWQSYILLSGFWLDLVSDQLI